MRSRLVGVSRVVLSPLLAPPGPIMTVRLLRSLETGLGG